MNENKPYELTVNDRGQLDFIDHIESKKRDAICIYNDLGVPPFSSAKAICDLLKIYPDIQPWDRLYFYRFELEEGM